MTVAIRDEPTLMCVMCGLIVVRHWEGDAYVSDNYPSKCSMNGGGAHIRPDSPAAEAALELRRRWLNPPHD